MTIFTEWQIVSFEVIDSHEIIRPYPVAGLQSIYSADLSNRRRSKRYLVVIYNNIVDELEVERAIQPSIESDIPLFMYLHVNQLALVRQIIKKLTFMDLTQTRHNDTIVDEDSIKDTIIASAAQSIDLSSISIIGRYIIEKDLKPMATPTGSGKKNSAPVNEDLVKNIFWGDPTYKRILFFILVDQNITRDDLRARVSRTGSSVDHRLNLMEKRKLITVSGNNISIEANAISFIKNDLFKPEFGGEPIEFRERIQKLFIQHASDHFNDAVRKIFSDISGEVAKPDDLMIKNIDKASSYPEIALYLAVVRTLQETENVMLASHIITIAGRRTREQSLVNVYIPIMAAPAFHADTVEFADELGNQIYLIDFVTLLRLEQIFRSTTDNTSRDSIKKNLRNAFEDQPFGSLWDPNNLVSSD